MKMLLRTFLMLTLCTLLASSGYGDQQGNLDSELPNPDNHEKLAECLRKVRRELLSCRTFADQQYNGCWTECDDSLQIVRNEIDSDWSDSDRSKWQDALKEAGRCLARCDRELRRKKSSCTSRFFSGKRLCGQFFR
jgi:hypothetical protein